MYVTKLATGDIFYATHRSENITIVIPKYLRYIQLYKIINDTNKNLHAMCRGERRRKRKDAKFRITRTT